jgi:diguanylate cyclase (GGDEF)-like protein
MPRPARVLASNAEPRLPVLLIASGQEWSARALRSVLAVHGYDVRIAHNARQLTRLAFETEPDVLIIEDNLPDMSAVEICRLLRSNPDVSPNTPILVTGSPSWSSESRIEALTAGAWDVVSVPINAEELVLRLNGYAVAKLEADRAQNDSLIDAATGFYNLVGFLRRLAESAAAAARFSRPLGCVVFEIFSVDPDDGLEGDQMWQSLNVLADALVATIRTADVAGRVGRTCLAVVADETEAEGSLRLAQRVIAAVEEAHSKLPFLVRAGYAVELNAADLIQPATLLAHAKAALRRAQVAGTTIEFFELEHPNSSA